MSSEPDSKMDPDFSLSFDDGASAPAKKAVKRAAAKKAVRKTAKKKAETAEKSEAVPAPVEAPAKPARRKPVASPDAGEFRPADFKGRGSHFDGAERVEVAAPPSSPASEVARVEAPRQEEREPRRSGVGSTEANREPTQAESHGADDSRARGFRDRPDSDRSEHRREGRPDQRSDDRSERRSDNRSERRVGERSEPRGDNRPEQRGDERPEQRLDTRPEQRGDERPEQRGDTRPEQRGDSRPEQRGDHGGHHDRRQHDGGGHGGHKQGFGKNKKFQKGGKHPQGGGQPNRGGPPQGGGKFHKPGKQGQGGSGWRQPAPPSDRDFVEGELPAASRFPNKEACETLLSELDQASLIDLTELYELKVEPLAAAARNLGVEFAEKPGRRQAIEELFKFAAAGKRAFKDVGHLDLTDDGYGFVVHSAGNYQLKPESVYVPESLVKEYGLKRGHLLEVLARAPEEGERCPAALRIVSAMGMAPEEMAKVTPFEDLTPYYPTERLVLETPMPSNNKKDVSMRVFDLLTPIGFGQRGLIVAPPRTGKTVLLQGLANSIQENYPEVHLIVLLIDERPEEVTDFRRNVKGEVVSSTFDETATSHVHAAEMVVEKARRMVEHGKKVVILLDSITRLARAYNTLASNSGKIMSGGIEASALQKPKRFFGSARNIEDGGDLTIMGSALVDTGSKMDEVIFEEFKGTGNMELHLDRELINKRIFPAISFERSGTRKEELLYHPQELEKVYSLRRVMQGVPGAEAMEMLIKRLKVTKNNVEFLVSLK